MLEAEEKFNQFIPLGQEDRYYDFSFDYVPSLYVVEKPHRETVRVILGQLGEFVRISAPEFDVVTEGSTPMEAWLKFLDEIGERFRPDENAWLSFDVGPTRPDEIAEGLNAPEDEDWSELLDDTEA